MDAGARGRSRWWICVAAAVVVLIVGTIVLAGSHQDQHAAGPASTSKSTQARSQPAMGSPAASGDSTPGLASTGAEGPANGAQSAQTSTVRSATAPTAPPPVAADVSISSCQAEPGNRARVIVDGTIVNHDTQTDDYTIIVSIQDGSQSVGEAFDTENAVAAGQSATWSAQGVLGGQTGTGLTCTLAWLHRTASD